MDKIVFATTNEGKVKEIKEILAGFPIEVVSMKEMNITADVEENGATFEENSLIKAREVSKLTGLPAMADDSGLEVDYLNGEPGIYSARYLGRDTDYNYKNNYIIEKLKNAKDEERSARFVCVISLVLPDGREFIKKGVMEGRIAYEIKGENGFGYDPVFYLPEYGMTSAELSGEEKNKISHRGKALGAMKELISEEKVVDINVKVFELYVENSNLKIGIRVRGAYDSRVRKPMVTVIFDNGKENRRIPMPVQAYYPSEDLKNFDFFAGYSYTLNQIFFKEYGFEKMRMSLEIAYGEAVFVSPVMTKSSDLLIYGSEFYNVGFGKKHTDIVITPLVEEQDASIKNVVLRALQGGISFLWNIVLIATSIVLLPIFTLEALLNFIYCVKPAPRNNKLGIMKILFHIKWRVSGIIRKNLSFGYLKLSLAKLGFNLFKMFKVKKNRIVFISNRRDNISGNYEYIYDKLIGNKELDIRTVFDTMEGYFTCFKYGYYMATAKVLLVDDYIGLIYKIPRREDNYLIQVWHACGAFKTFGFSRLGRPGGPKQKNSDHRNYDFCTVSSSEICKYYAEGFGLSLEKVIPTGVPRTDIFFSEEYKEKARKEFYGKYPDLKDKKIVLFAPTFRGNGKKSGFYPENRFDFIKLYEHFSGAYVIII